MWQDAANIDLGSLRPVILQYYTVSPAVTQEPLGQMPDLNPGPPAQQSWALYLWATHISQKIYPV